MSRWKKLSFIVTTLSILMWSVCSYGQSLNPKGGIGIRATPEHLQVKFDHSAAGGATRSGPADGLASSQGAVDAQGEALDEGHEKELKEAEAALGAVKTAMSTLDPSIHQYDMAGMKELLGAFSFYSNLHGTCVKTQSTASGLCREKTSPHLQKSLNDMNTIMGMIGGVAVKDACSNMAKLMRIGQAGLTAYTAACSAARAACEGACSTVNANLKRIVKILPTEAKLIECTGVKTDPEGLALAEPACGQYRSAVKTFLLKLNHVVKLDSDLAVRKSIALKNKACTYEYANMLLSAGVGIASVMNSLKQSKDCEEQTNGTGVVATEEEKAKCADPKNAALPECICMANPRTPGCSNGYTKPGENSSASLIAGNKATGGGSTIGNKGPGPSTLGGGGDEDKNLAFTGNSDSDGAGAFGSGSGGGGLGGGGLAGTGKGAGEGAEEKKGLNANILGAAGGGGGGGGGSWSGVRGSGAASAYRAYLPGGAKDPARGLAGQQSWTREVTGQGGKSNWEKVRDRYRDNKNSLLSN